MKTHLCSLFFILCVCLSTSAQTSQFKGWVLYEEDSEPHQFLVVQNAKELEDFRKRIPKRVPSKKHPAPDNKDPLLKDGAVDFAKHILVLALRGETISAHPVHLSSDTQNDQIVLRFRSPAPPPEARPYGWGVYRGILIPRTSKLVVVEFE